MSTQHTPGPWQLSEYTWKDGLGTYRRVEQVEGFGDVVASVCIGHSANHTLDACADANARLIAAAPDLLFELKKCASLLKTAFGETNDLTGKAVIAQRLESVTALIAKATGAA
jgi:hypothetical protein